MSRVIKSVCLELGAPLTLSGRHGVIEPPGAGPAATAGTAALDLAGKKAERILADAQARAEAIVDQAVQGAGRIAEEAHRQGFEEGRQEGLAAARAEAEAILAEARQVRESAENERMRRLEELEPEIVRLSMAVAERIIRHKIAGDEDVALRALKEILPRLDSEGEITIHLNPADLPLPQEDLAVIARGARVVVREEPGIEPGGCIVEALNGRADARISTQLAEIGDALLGGEAG